MFLVTVPTEGSAKDAAAARSGCGDSTIKALAPNAQVSAWESKSRQDPSADAGTEVVDLMLRCTCTVDIKRTCLSQRVFLVTVVLAFLLERLRISSSLDSDSVSEEEDTEFFSLWPSE